MLVITGSPMLHAFRIPDRIDYVKLPCLSRNVDGRYGARSLPRVAWSYPQPLEGAEALADCVSFYPGELDCTVDGAAVRPQPGGFYGGWITPELVGPFKGDPGSQGW